MAQPDNPFNFNPWGHSYPTTPKFDPKFDLYKQDEEPSRTDQLNWHMYRLGRNRRLPQSDKAPIIEGGSIPEIQADIVWRDRERMNEAFHDEEFMRRQGEMYGRIAERDRLEKEEQQRRKQRQREDDIREMSELDRRTPKYGKFEGFPLPPRDTGTELDIPTDNPFRIKR